MNEHKELMEWLDKLDRDLARLEVAVMCIIGVVAVAISIMIWGAFR